MNRKLHVLLTTLSSAYQCCEEEKILVLSEIIKRARSSSSKNMIFKNASKYVQHIRSNMQDIGMESFLRQYDLDTKEGIAIISLAEALLRIPDNKTIDELIYDKLINSGCSFNNKSGSSKLMKSSAIGLKILKRFINKSNLTSKITAPVIRNSILQSIKLLGNHFILGQTIEQAVHSSKKIAQQGYLFSFDMLGETAATEQQAQIFLNKYLEAINALRAEEQNSKSIYNKPSISIKLSALHPKFTITNRDKVIASLLPKLKLLLEKAEEADISVTFDAEESSKLDLSLEIFSLIITDKDLSNNKGVGIAVQAYQKHAHYIIDYIEGLAQHTGKKIPVRLVKGAYWDSEIKMAQLLGLTQYPVFTKKNHTDISYLACAYKMLEKSDYIYSQFATHNAVTIAELEIAAEGKDFEFQLLYGMGKHIYDQLVGKYKCRIYAPVGKYKELLPYLLRRLLENAANSSFVKQIADNKIDANNIIKDPLDTIDKEKSISLPVNLFSDRENSIGIDFGNRAAVASFLEKIAQFTDKKWSAAPLIGENLIKRSGHEVYCPYDISKTIGQVTYSNIDEINNCIKIANDAHQAWSNTDVSKRASILNNMANLLEEHKYEAISLCMQEAGKTMLDATNEVREAIDFCRYYAKEAILLMSVPKTLNGPTGETNQLSLHGRGVFVCISPWNFPLAIFLGQITAALVTGNTVIAKPAEQTSLIAFFATELLLKAGIPAGVINLLPGKGNDIGGIILKHPSIAGVVFTGSVFTARKINNILSENLQRIIPFIAETGGQNAMIVDSSALIEQTVNDIILSAFGSAGQRCSALRVLYLQDEIADDLLQILKGAMEILNIGNPENIDTDIGPVINIAAKNILLDHIKHLKINHKLVAPEAEESFNTEKNGYFLNPHLFEINALSDLKDEVFGPILHIIRYKYENIDEVIKQINSTGFGLTLGIQSRINARVEYICKRVNIGNIYVNRTMIGAVVGVQPFGGEGLSGTGPKAGGPNYLLRFTTERTYTENTTAIGGNYTLLS
jgi:RHH-type proline utilization regulon transcriptional repressor/proline dehydrogenase/delta 1-pyrroline-5-carboxylate dehydrogenase